MVGGAERIGAGVGSEWALGQDGRPASRNDPDRGAARHGRHIWWWRRREPPAHRRRCSWCSVGARRNRLLCGRAAASRSGPRPARAVRAAALPVGLFPAISARSLARMLLVHESRRHDERERLALTQFAIEHSTEALFWIDAEGRIVTGQRGRRAPHRLRARRAAHANGCGSSRSTARPSAGYRIWAEARAGRRHVDERSYRRPRRTARCRWRPPATSSAYAGREWISVFARDVTERPAVEQERAEHSRAASRRSPPGPRKPALLKDQFPGHALARAAHAADRDPRLTRRAAA